MSSPAQTLMMRQPSPFSSAVGWPILSAIEVEEQKANSNDKHSSKSTSSPSSATTSHTPAKEGSSTTPANAEPATEASTVSKASSPLSDPTLREDIYTLPNILTFSRLAAAPFIGYFVLHDSHAWAAGLLAYAGVTDLLDGWIARKWNSKTVVGTVIDPMADKVLMTVLTVCLAVKGALPGTFVERVGPDGYALFTPYRRQEEA